jgi:hypothetical protein
MSSSISANFFFSQERDGFFKKTLSGYYSVKEDQYFSLFFFFLGRNSPTLATVASFLKVPGHTR